MMKKEILPTRVWKLLPVILLFLTAGCGALKSLEGKNIPDNIFDLTPKAGTLSQRADPAIVLFFENVTYSPFMATEKIIIKSSPQEIQYLAGARWTDQAPGLLNRYFVLSLENLDNILVIGSQDTARLYDYRVSVDVRDFSAHLQGAGPPVVRVEIMADLMKTGPLKGIARKGFVKEVPAGANTKAGIVEAYNIAVQAVASDLRNWLDEMVQ